VPVGRDDPAPVLVFTALNRYFSVGGIGGSLAGA
jgi:hypothetical protein